MRRLGLVALLAIAALGAGAGWLDSQLSRPPRGRYAEKIFMDIPRGTSRWSVAGILARNNLIRSRLAFALFSVWHFRRPLQAGEYLFDKPLNSREVFWKIAHGQIFVHVVTVPEGWTMREIAGEIEKQGLCSRQDFLAATSDTASVSDLAPGAKNLEGFLFPSTYEFARHTSCDQVARRMVQDFRAAWKTLDPTGTAELPGGLTVAQVVTLASLVERETPKADERPLVAGVFYNRLRRGFPLQCDPTVQYAKSLTGDQEKKVHPQDLRIKSPYNTYVHRGLPPGPIASPGEASLRAALNPAQTDYMYFVANDQRGHFFSRTLEEHNRNVALYRHLVAGDAPPPPSDHQKKTKHRRRT